jgi:hypothetical protein
MLPDLDAMMQYWLGLLGLTQDNGWRISWGWVDEIPHPNGGEAVGLNRCDGQSQNAAIAIRKPRSAAELKDLDDTVAHEAVHCLGVRMEWLLDQGRETEAHEYLAETLAPAMVRIKGTPRAKVLAKLAKQLPSRAKGTRMDKAAIIAMIALIQAASSPEEKENMLAALQAQLESMPGEGGEAPAMEAPLAADPPPPATEPDKKPDDGTALGMSDEQRLAKDPAMAKVLASAVEGLIEARPDLTAEQSAFAKALGTPDLVRSYFKTIAMPKQEPAKQEPKPKLGMGATPRGKPAPTQAARTLLKEVSNAMGLPATKAKGPHFDPARNVFTLGSLTPTQYRAKRASGWDPRNEFPMPDLEAS